MTPALSLLIPVRNAAATLDQALGSIAAQTFRDWEAIVVDDASSDDTRRLLSAWRRRDERFQILRHSEPQGAPACLQLALDAASGGYIARMDADDVSLPRRLQIQVERLSAGDAAVVGCRVRCLGSEATSPVVLHEQEWVNSLLTPAEHDRDIFLGCPIPDASLVARADAIRAVGGYLASAAPHGYDLCLRLWEAGYRMAKVPDCLFLWRRCEASAHGGEMGTSAGELACKVAVLRRTHLRDAAAAVVFGAGSCGRAVAGALREAGTELLGYVDVDTSGRPGPFARLPIMPREEGLALRGKAFGLLAVDDPALRAALRRELQAAGWRDTEDFRCIT